MRKIVDSTFGHRKTSRNPSESNGVVDTYDFRAQSEFLRLCTFLVSWVQRTIYSLIFLRTYLKPLETKPIELSSRSYRAKHGGGDFGILVIRALALLTSEEQSDHL